jgi:hypothetical protein
MIRLQKKYLTLIFLFALLLFSFCGSGIKTAGAGDKKLIDSSDVAEIDVLKEAFSTDTFPPVKISLNRIQIKDFVQKWNDGKNPGPIKCLGRYTIWVHFKSENVREFIACDNMVREPAVNGYAFDFGDENYFERFFAH